MEINQIGSIQESFYKTDILGLSLKINRNFFVWIGPN